MKFICRVFKLPIMFIRSYFKKCEIQIIYNNAQLNRNLNGRVIYEL